MESGSSELFEKVELELEDLNLAAEEVNKFEVLLEEVKENLHKAKQSASFTKTSIRKRLGSCVEKAQPYYEAQKKEQAIIDDKQDTEMLLERAKLVVDRARAEVDKIEGEVLEESRGFSPNRQMRLNEATIKLDEAIKEMMKIEKKGKDLEKKHDEVKHTLNKLHHQQRNNIKKATEYFECCTELDCTLRCWETKLEVVQTNIEKAKEKYKTAMTHLEEISNSVHQGRDSQSKEVSHGDGDDSLGYVEIDAKVRPRSLEIFPGKNAARDSYPSLKRERRGQSVILYSDYNPPERTSLCLEEEGDSHLRKDLRAILDRFLTTVELKSLDDGLDLENDHDLQVPELDCEEDSELHDEEMI